MLSAHGRQTKGDATLLHRIGLRPLFPLFHFNDAISLVVLCENQEEIDRYWNALLAGGGKEQACGSLIDRFGLRWQIVPSVLDEMMRNQDPNRSKRVTDALLKMVKLDIAGLQNAYNS